MEVHWHALTLLFSTRTRFEINKHDKACTCTRNMFSVLGKRATTCDTKHCTDVDQTHDCIDIPCQEDASYHGLLDLVVDGHRASTTANKRTMLWSERNANVDYIAYVGMGTTITFDKPCFTNFKNRTAQIQCLLVSLTGTYIRAIVYVIAYISAQGARLRICS